MGSDKTRCETGFLKSANFVQNVSNKYTFKSAYELEKDIDNKICFLLHGEFLRMTITFWKKNFTKVRYIIMVKDGEFWRTPNDNLA